MGLAVNRETNEVELTGGNSTNSGLPAHIQKNLDLLKRKQARREMLEASREGLDCSASYPHRETISDERFIQYERFQELELILDFLLKKA